MTESEPTRQELDARTDPQHRFGIDSEGNHHYVDRTLDAIWVVRQDTILQVVTGVSMTHWREVVAERTGWSEYTHSEQPTSDWLVEAVEVA